jgi:hypothetical protein
VCYLCMLVKTEPARAHTHTHTHTRTPSRASARTHTYTTHTQLTSLSLSNNLLGDDYLCLLVSAACTATALTFLDLSHNAEPSTKRKQGHKAGAALRTLLASNSCLTNLNLSWNALSETSGASVALGLQSNWALTSLDLSWNSFGRTDAIKPLATNPQKSSILPFATNAQKSSILQPSSKVFYAAPKLKSPLYSDHDC